MCGAFGALITPDCRKVNSLHDGYPRDAMLDVDRSGLFEALRLSRTGQAELALDGRGRQISGCPARL